MFRSHSLLSLIQGGAKLQGGSILNIEQYWKDISSALSGSDEKSFDSTGNSSTYGYLTKDGMNMFLTKMTSQPTVFYDLGSGLGMPVVFASMLIPSLKKSIGIEFSFARHTAANYALSKLRKAFPSRFQNIQLHHGDVTSNNYNYRDADMIWVSNLCFKPRLNDVLTNKLNKELKAGTHVFMSQAMPNLNHSSHEEFQVQQSWNKTSTVHHYVI